MPDALPALGRSPLAKLDVEDKLALIEEGMPFEQFALLAATFRLTPAAFLERIGTPTRTLHRRLAGAPLNSQETERVLRINQLYEAALARSGDMRAAVRWITETGRFERAAVGLEMSQLLEELNAFSSSSSLAQTIPIPELPHGFTAGPWENDERMSPPNTIALRCELTAQLNGTSASVFVRIAPGLDSSVGTIRRHVYERFVAAIEELRLQTFSCA